MHRSTSIASRSRQHYRKTAARNPVEVQFLADFPSSDPTSSCSEQLEASGHIGGCRIQFESRSLLSENFSFFGGYPPAPGSDYCTATCVRMPTLSKHCQAAQSRVGQLEQIRPAGKGRKDRKKRREQAAFLRRESPDFSDSSRGAVS